MNEIRHYGIAGQKHGERRYQNEDGTYTELGKERRRTGSRTYGELTRKEKRQLKKERKAEKKRESNAARRAEAIAQGDYNYAVDHINEFSNEEINELVKRYNVMNQVVTIQKKEAEEAKKKMVSVADKMTSMFKFAANISDSYSKIENASKAQADARKAKAQADIEEQRALQVKKGLIKLGDPAQKGDGQNKSEKKKDDPKKKEEPKKKEKKQKDNTERLKDNDWEYVKDQRKNTRNRSEYDDDDIIDAWYTINGSKKKRK